MDIKWKNIVINGDINTNSFIIKLIDFDIANSFGYLYKKIVGTPKYISWISISKFLISSEFVVEKHNDIWAFCIMCFESLYMLLYNIIPIKKSKSEKIHPFKILENLYKSTNNYIINETIITSSDLMTIIPFLNGVFKNLINHIVNMDVSVV